MDFASLPPAVIDTSTSFPAFTSTQAIPTW